MPELILITGGSRSGKSRYALRLGESLGRQRVFLATCPHGDAEMEQRIQHHAADMYSDVETMRLITYELAWLVSEGRPCAEELAVAKTWVSSAYTRMTRMGIQIYGGIGMAKEMDPQLYFRRAKAWEPLFGGPDEHRAVLAETIGAETSGADTRNGDGPGLST